MKCAKCGAELKEGCLYCDQCGEEYNIVPEYDFLIESQITETLGNVAKDINSPKEDIDPTKEAFRKIDEEEDAEFCDDWKEIIKNKKVEFPLFFKKISKVSKLAFLGVTCLLILFVFIVKHNTTDSYEYQYAQAVSSAKNGDMEQAIYYMEKALAINPENTDAQFLLAGYYYDIGQPKSAISILKELIEENPYNIESIYDSLIQIYLKENDYYSLSVLFHSCNNVKILSKYNSYVANPPTFSKSGGAYNELIALTLEGNTQGNIFYTMDGSNPDENSKLYEEPILLDAGKYVIKAIFINLYGIKSEIVTQKYDINILPLEAPSINPSSGSFHTPTMIEVYYEDNTEVYYTLDGTDPTTSSKHYTEPIEMPFGVSNFSFIAIDRGNGRTSDVIRRTYQLSLNNVITPELAKQVLLNNLQVKGIIMDQTGHISDKLGTNDYQIKSVVEIDNANYYIFAQVYIDTTGTSHETGDMYAIDVVSGDPYIAQKVREGQYTLKAL